METKPMTRSLVLDTLQGDKNSSRVDSATMCSIESRDGSNAVAVSSSQAKQLRSIFTKYCNYGAPQQVKRPERLTGPKFERLLRDTSLFPMLSEQQRHLFRALYLDDMDMQMDFSDFLRALGHIAASSLASQPRKSSGPAFSPSAPSPRSFSRAVHRLLEEHLNVCNQIEESTASVDPLHSENSPSKVLDHDESNSPQDINSPIAPAEDGSTNADHFSSECSNTEDQPHEEHQKSVAHLTESSALDSHRVDEAPLSMHSVGTFESGHGLLVSPCSRDADFEEADSESTTSTQAFTLASDAFPLDSASAILRKPVGPELVQIGAAEVELLHNIFEQYAPHWCSGAGKDFLARRCLRSRPSHATSPKRSSLKRPRFIWTMSMCFGGFASFAQDYRIASADNKDLKAAFLATLGIQQRQLWHRALSFHDFVRAAAGLVTLQAKRKSSETNAFTTFEKSMQQLIQTCQSCFIPQCTLGMSNQEGEEDCASCADPYAIVRVIPHTLPSVCRQDPASHHLLEDARTSLQAIFNHYCEHKSVTKTSLEPCRGARCAGPQPLLPETAFMAFCKDFELSPRFLSEVQLTSLFQIQARRMFDSRREGGVGIAIGTTSDSDPLEAKRISFPAFVAVLAHAAIKALSRYPYERLASTPHEKIALLFKRMQVSQAFADILGPTAALQPNLYTRKESAANAVSAHECDHLRLEARRKASRPASLLSNASTSSSSSSSSTSSISTVISPGALAVPSQLCAIPPQHVPPGLATSASSSSSSSTSSAASGTSSSSSSRPSLTTTSASAAPSGLASSSTFSVLASLSEASEAVERQAERRRKLQRDYDRALRRKQARRRAAALHEHPCRDQQQQQQQQRHQLRAGGLGPGGVAASTRRARPVTYASTASTTAARRPKPEPIRSLFAPRTRDAPRRPVHAPATKTAADIRLAVHELDKLTLEEKIDLALR